MDGDYIRQMQEGTLDSSGRFTLDRQRRSSALVLLVEIEPYIFLGRFLQAATVANVSLAYSVTGRGIVIRLRPSDPSAFHDLLEYFRGAPPRGRFQDYLDLGFLSAKALQPRQLIWSFRDRSGGYRCDLLKPNDLSTLPPTKAPPEGRLEFAWPTPRGWLAAMKQLLVRRTQATDFLKTRCCYSTVPVSLDGVPLDIRTSFSYSGTPRWMSPYFLAMSVQLEGKDCPPGAAFNSLGPGYMKTFSAQFEGAELPPLTPPLHTRKAVGLTPADPWMSYIQVTCTGSYTLTAEPLNDETPSFIPNSKKLLAVQADVEFDHTRDLVIRIKQALYFESPDCQLPLPDHSRGFFDPMAGCPLFRCRRLMVITKSGIVLGKQPVRSATVLIRDGLAVEPPSKSVIEGAIVIMSIPDCQMDADEWRVIQDGTYENKMQRLQEDFRSFSAFEAASRAQTPEQPQTA